MGWSALQVSSRIRADQELAKSLILGFGMCLTIGAIPYGYYIKKKLPHLYKRAKYVGFINMIVKLCVLVYQ